MPEKIKGCFINENNVKYIAYGVMYEDDKRMSIEDISTNADFVDNIIRKIDENDVHSVHIKDIVEDMLI